MHTDHLSRQGPPTPIPAREAPSSPLALDENLSQSSPAGLKGTAQQLQFESPSAEHIVDLSTTAPIHKVPRWPSRPLVSSQTPRTSSAPDAASKGLNSEHQTVSPATYPLSRSSTKVTGVATIILPPHQSQSLTPIASSTLCLAQSGSTTSSASSTPSPLSPVKPSLCHTVSPQSSFSPAAAETVIVTSASSPTKQPVCIIARESKESLPKNAAVTVVNLSQYCSTASLDLNNNNLPSTITNSIDTPPFDATATTSNTFGNKESSIVNTTYSYNSGASKNVYNSTAFHSTSKSNKSDFDNPTPYPLDDFETIQTTDFTKEFEKDRAPFAGYTKQSGDEVFMDTNESNKDNRIDRCTPVANLKQLSPHRADTEYSPASYHNTLPPFSVFNDSYFHSDTRKDNCNSTKDASPHQYYPYPYYHHHQQHQFYYPRGSGEDQSLSAMNAGYAESNSPEFGLNRSDSGFGGSDYALSTYSSRNNSSSSSTTSCTSMDLDYDDTGCNNSQEMAEERNYTDLTTVRSLCPGQELLTGVYIDDDESHLKVFLNDSGSLNGIKSEPLDDFNVNELFNNLETSEFESDGYESSSTDNGQAHYTQLEEASSYSLFGGNNIIDNFSPLPVTPSDHSISSVPPMGPHCIAQTSPEDDQSFVGQWGLAKENVPDFGKLQDPSTEKEEKPAQSRRRSVCSPKEKKKPLARESPALSDKSSSDRKKPGRKKGQTSNVLHLWEFMRDLLKDPSRCGDVIEWISKKDGVFRVVNSAEVARLWGEKKKNKKEMTYEKMSRSLRYSRLEGYFTDLPKDKNYPKKLCFKFGPKSDWS